MMFGGVSFEGGRGTEGCTESVKSQVKEKLVRILTQLDSVFGLCDHGQVCNYTQNLHVLCTTHDAQHSTQHDVQHIIKRRSSASWSSTSRLSLEVEINLNVSNRVQHLNGFNEGSLRQGILQAIRQDEVADIFLVSSVDIVTKPLCSPGQILVAPDNPDQSTEACLECPLGHKVSEDSTQCTPCLHGFYRSEQSVTCVQCPDGLTTYISGATRLSQCLPVCTQGMWYSLSANQCVPCPRGTYLDMTGMLECKYCPYGQSTLNAGATSVSDCVSVCGPGQEITADQTCQPCERGSYRHQSSTTSYCEPCDYQNTTLGRGSIDKSQCSLIRCERGHHHVPDSGACVPCPLGTFQSKRGAWECSPCGVGLTTPSVGAVNSSMCGPGLVDECRLHIDTE